MCTTKYSGQTGRTFLKRYKENTHNIKNNKETTGPSKHNSSIGQERGKIEDTMKILDTINKGPQMNSLENFHI
jgi:hypothetical protein